MAVRIRFHSIKIFPRKLRYWQISKKLRRKTGKTRFPLSAHANNKLRSSWRGLNSYFFWIPCQSRFILWFSSAGSVSSYWLNRCYRLTIGMKSQANKLHTLLVNVDNHISPSFRNTRSIFAKAEPAHTCTPSAEYQPCLYSQYKDQRIQKDYLSHICTESKPTLWNESYIM